MASAGHGSQIRACVISARKANNLEVTTMFTNSHANTPHGQSERGCYLVFRQESNGTERESYGVGREM